LNFLNLCTITYQFNEVLKFQDYTPRLMGAAVNDYRNVLTCGLFDLGAPLIDGQSLPTFDFKPIAPDLNVIAAIPCLSEFARNWNAQSSLKDRRDLPLGNLAFGS
jgi:hypothetical protein